MKSFKKALNEVYLELGKLIVFDDILTAFLVFLGFFAFLIVTDITPLFSFVPALAYMGYRVYLDVSAKRNKVVLVEKKYPQLDEKFRTAFDNLKLDNPVVEELQEEVYGDLKKVQTASFLDTKRTTYKLVAVALLCFLILFLALNRVEFIDFDKAFLDMRQYAAVGNGTGNTSENPFSSGMAGNKDLFGNESFAELGNEILDLEIALEGIEPTSVRSEEDIVEEFDETFPDDIDLVAACREPPCVFENDIPIDQQELVKNYFIELAKK